MHARLRTHAESIAFFGGGFREKEVRCKFIIVFLTMSLNLVNL